MDNNLMQSEGLRILAVSGENFKKLKHVHLQFGGKSFLVTGPNEAGKSSLIQMLQSPMDKKVLPTDPIKTGEEKANIALLLGGVIRGNYEEYTLELFFSKGKKNGRLVVKNQQGEVMNTPSTFVESLIGNVSFDIMRWLNLSPKEKLNIIKQLTGASQQIDAINLEISNKKSEYSNKKSRAEDLESILNNHVFSQQEVDMYSTPKPLEAMQQEMLGISEQQKVYDQTANQMNSFHQNIQRFLGDIDVCQNEIRELEQKIQEKRMKIDSIQKDIDTTNQNITIGNQWFTLEDGSPRPRPSVEDVSARINEAIRHNERHNQIKTLSDQQREMISAKEAMGNIKSEIESLETKRSEIISGSQLPVKGLSFDNDTIFLDGLPLEEEQINTARLFDVGVDIAIAMHPNLKTIFLKQGSLIDDNNLYKMIQKVEKLGYQIIAEMVDSKGGELEIKFTETLMQPTK